jgi:hypothetical protein
MLHDIDLFDKLQPIYVKIQTVTISKNTLSLEQFLRCISRKCVSFHQLWKWWTMLWGSNNCWLFQMSMSAWFYWQSVWFSSRNLTYAFFRCLATLLQLINYLPFWLVILASGCDPGCQNGGMCNGNTCMCPVQYSGILCEKRSTNWLSFEKNPLNFCHILDYCLPRNPCQNGGRCTSTGTSHVCDCTSTGYTGIVCTEPVVAGKFLFVTKKE